ncbi:putative metal-dependent phosphoesterase TrpH [Ruminiclostridium sufflavum DSM 19573]|uniref:Putative metal-dependent phosphoesterase TrpH n=1 Tax=Ruminiclostridium sufflavum DSM 19573 TaxID=1121337 RepID=A0A318XK22_9FIRM|nr:CehA/McbA family metallohydrolase [Ruminiclostridium sufflavum]PYG86886.1 putative metal-dependent phosphoesterase TrpH [Ruminiclostridium sufflavum DSM 19573]
MKRFISFILGLAFTKNQLNNSRDSDLKSNSDICNESDNPELSRGDIEISVIAPPVICKAESFPVIAAVTNTRSKGSVYIRSAKCNWNEKEYRKELREELEASGDSLRAVEELRSRTDLLTDSEQRKLKSRYEKLKKATEYIRFNLDKEMIQELNEKGVLELVLTIEGDGVRDRKAVKGSKKIKLQCNRTLQRLPAAPGLKKGNWYFGDTHSHSTYTWDYYFGDGIYTIQELKPLAKAAGLDWLTLTDHAYCLNSKKFETQKHTVTALSDNSFAFLYGEELSCAELVNNSKSRDTCHCNGILNNTFVPCTTDFFRKASSPDSQQGINNLRQNGGLVTINHANWGKSMTEPWNFGINTYAYTHGETGMEILNGGWADNNKGSTTRWIDKRLLHGEKVYPFAGSDTESKNHLGECYTVVYADKLTHESIKAGLSRGHHYVTTYPGLAFWARKAGASDWSWMGDTLAIGSGTVELQLSYCNTTNGMNIYVIKGKTGWTQEQQVYSTAVNAGKGFITAKIPVEKECYLRAYCVEEDKKSHRAYTTPIWFE